MNPTKDDCKQLTKLVLKQYEPLPRFINRREFIKVIRETIESNFYFFIDENMIDLSFVLGQVAQVDYNKLQFIKENGKWSNN